MLVLKKITPVFNHVLTTKDVYDKDVKENGILVETKGTVKRYQRVVAVGPQVKSCKAGDMVMIDPIRYGKMKHRNGAVADGVIEDDPKIEYNIPVVIIDGKEFMYIGDNDIQFIINQFQETEDLPPLWTPSKDIIS